MATIRNLPVTYWNDAAKAAEIAAANQADADAGDEYRVEPYATGYCVALYVDGDLVGRL